MTEKSALDMFDIPTRSSVGRPNPNVTKNTSPATTHLKKNETKDKSSLSEMLNGIDSGDKDCGNPLSSFMGRFSTVSAGIVDSDSDEEIDHTNGNHERQTICRSLIKPNTLQQVNFNESVINSLTAICCSEMVERISQPLNITADQNNHIHKTIPSLIDFQSLKNLNVDIDYALIASLHQCSQRSDLTATAALIDVFINSLVFLSTEHSVVAPALSMMLLGNNKNLSLSKTITVEPQTDKTTDSSKTDFIVKLLLQHMNSSEASLKNGLGADKVNHSILLLFLLNIIQDEDTNTAYKLVCDAIVTAQSLLPSDATSWDSSVLLLSASSGMMAYDKKIQLLSIVTQLQIILSLLDWSFYNASVASSELCSRELESNSNTEAAITLSHMFNTRLTHRLQRFVSKYRSLLPLLSLTVKTAFVFCSIGERPDILRILLTPDPKTTHIPSHTAPHGSGGGGLPNPVSSATGTTSVVSALVANSHAEQSYLSAITQLIKPPPLTPVDATIPAATAVNNQPTVGAATATAPMVSSVDKSMFSVEGDEGYKYVQRLNRDQCNKLLLVESPGAFIIRPHESNADQYFLSFRAAPEEGVKHAIVRRERRVTGGLNNHNDNSTSGNAEYVYQCGKIGPCTTMMEILREISKILACPLLFNTIVQYNPRVLCPHIPLDLNHGLWSTTLSASSSDHFVSLLNSVAAEQYNPYASAAADGGEATRTPRARQRQQQQQQLTRLLSGKSHFSQSHGDIGWDSEDERGYDEDDEGEDDDVSEDTGFGSPTPAAEDEEGDFGDDSPLSPTTAGTRTNVWHSVPSTRANKKTSGVYSGGTNNRGGGREKSARLLCSGDESKWCVSKQSRVMSDLVEHTVAFLAIKEHFKQLTTTYAHIINKLYTTEVVLQDTENRRDETYDDDDEAGQQQQNLYLLAQVMNVLCPNAVLQTHNNFVRDSTAANMGAANINIPNTTNSSATTTAMNDKNTWAVTLDKHITLFEHITRPITRFLLHTERALHAVLLPAVPQGLHFIAPPYAYPECTDVVECAAGRYPDRPDTEGVLLAESLMKLIIRSMPVRYVKFPGHGNGLGGTEYIAENCLEIAEMGQLLIKWRMVTQKFVDASIAAAAALSEGVNTGDSTSSVHENMSTSSSSLTASTAAAATAGMGDSFYEPTDLTKIGTHNSGNKAQKLANKLSKNFKQNISKLHLPTVSTSGHGHNNSPKGSLSSPMSGKLHSRHQRQLSSSSNSSFTVDSSYQDTTRNIIEIIQRVNCYLEIPETIPNCVNNVSDKEYVQRVYSWLFTQRVMQQVTKMADHAFALPTTYHKYIDPWEARVLHDFSLSSERVRLGRHTYGPCHTIAATNSINNHVASAGIAVGAHSGATLRTAASAGSFHSTPVSPTATARAAGVASPSVAATAATADLMRRSASSTAVFNKAAPSHEGSHGIANTPMTSLSDSALSLAAMRAVSTRNNGSTLVEQLLEYHQLTRRTSTVAIASVGFGGGDGELMECYKHSAEYRASLLGLWEQLSAEMYVISTIANSLPPCEREMIPTVGTATTNGTGAPSQQQQQQAGTATAPALTPTVLTNATSPSANPYLSTLHRFMYRNAQFSRLHLPHRYVPNIQVDIYNLKEVLSVSSKTITKSVTIGGGGGANGGLAMMSASSTTATLTPSVSSHGSNIDIFTTIRLTKATTRKVDAAQFSSNKTVHFDSTVVSASHKAETNRSASGGGVSGVSSAAAYRNGITYSTRTINTITSISNSLDYVWREQAIFRHALPEGLLSPHLPRPNTLHSSEASHQPINTAGNTSTMYTTANLNMYCPYDKIVVGVYERSFFSDHKLGEVEIRLGELTDKRVIRDWFPLINTDKCVSWLIYLQIKLKFQMMCVDATPAPHSTSTSTSTVGVAGGGTGHYNPASAAVLTNTWPEQQRGRTRTSSNSSNHNASASAGRRGSGVGGKKTAKKSTFMSQLEDFF